MKHTFCARYFSVFLFLILAIIGCKEKPKGVVLSDTDNKAAYDFESALYRQAYNNGDHHTAVVAISRMLIMDSTQTHFYDSLSRHYLALGNARSASFYAEKALDLDPGNLKMLELAGYIYFEGGSFRKSEEKFAKLYQITKEHRYLYQLSQIYGYMGDVKKSNEMTDIILKDPAADDVYVEIATSEGQVQMVKVKAAAHFVKANLQQTPKQAVSSLNKAIAIQPDFEIARKIREELEIDAKMKEIQANEERLNQLRR